MQYFDVDKEMEWYKEAPIRTYIGKEKKFVKKGVVRRKPKPVNKLDMSGNVIEMYKDVFEASKDMHVTKNAIYGCLSGHLNACCGFKWEWVK